MKATPPPLFPRPTATTAKRTAGGERPHLARTPDGTAAGNGQERLPSIESTAMMGWYPRQKGARRPSITTSRLIWSLSVLIGLIGACVPPPPPLRTAPIFNFHDLEPGRAYRSAQPDALGLILAIVQFNIRTVVNLRGASPGESWYINEKAVCDAMGVTLKDHAMDGGTLPPGDTLRTVVHTLQTAEYPILIHCHMGADRTGAISAIYRMLMLGHTRAEALTELSPFYFHSRDETPCMDKLVEIYEPQPAWLERYTETVSTISCTP